MNRYAPPQYSRLKHLVFWFMGHLRWILSSSVHVQCSCFFLLKNIKNPYDALKLSEEWVLCLCSRWQQQHEILSKRIHHGIITSSVRKRLPCKYRCNGNNRIILDKQSFGKHLITDTKHCHVNFRGLNLLFAKMHRLLCMLIHNIQNISYIYYTAHLVWKKKCVTTIRIIGGNDTSRFQLLDTWGKCLK